MGPAPKWTQVAAASRAAVSGIDEARLCAMHLSRQRRLGAGKIEQNGGVRMLLFVAICLWSFMGLLGAMIGSRKGEGCAGFFMGVLLGPFGILIMLFSKGDRVQCPACRELMRRAAYVCPHCRTDFTPKPKPAE